MAKLTVIDGPDTGLEFELEHDRAESTGLTLGRDPRVELPLTDSAVSREHCRLEGTRRGFRLVDLGSRNRTWVNGDPVETLLLRDGDVIRIGDTDLKFASERAAELTGVESTIVKSLPVGGPATHAPLIAALEAAGASADGAPAEAAKLRRLGRVLDVSRRVREAETVPELLDGFLAAIVPALRANRGAFLTRGPEGWVARHAHPADEDGPLAASVSVVERAARESSAILCRDAEGDPVLGASQSVVTAGIRTALAAPAVHKGRVLGVVHIDRRGESDAFDDDDLEALRAAVDPLGAALARLEREEELAEENRNLLRGISESRRIIGESEAMREVLEFLGRAAPTDMTVLIEGETGTGKELVAHALHLGSPRRSRPFVAINCAALPENLVESELFGHERGAFTGAVSRRKGRFEQAHTGTIFLDEIGELTPACQAKLLRLLEERRFERVGGTESVEVDVRVVAATNKRLLDAVERGEFREDLLYRLNVLEVRLPPLRERREDIPGLVAHFLALAASSGRRRKLTKAAEKCLAEYDWPGNVRQLRNVIESATVLARGEDIRPDDLSLPAVTRAGREGEWKPLSLSELEKIHVLRTLDHTSGNKKKAAEILGIERCTLYSKLKTYDAQESRE